MTPKAAIAALLIAVPAVVSVAQAPAGLRIVVIAGEEAVNIIQQKTAVAPIVEVRDRNDVPVSGAVVTFTVSGAKTASFGGGLSTLSVTTNAAGRAVAAGLNPLAGGAVQINVQAAFQGQLAATTIAQTNVLTAAEAAAIGASGASSTPATGAASGSSGGTGGAASGAAGSSGGGLSGAAIAGIAGAAAGGAVVALKASGGEGSTGGAGPQGPPPPSGPTRTIYSGPVNGQLAVTTTSTGPSPGAVTGVCTSTRAIAGTLTITIDLSPDGSISGSGSTTGTQTEISVTVSPLCSSNIGTMPFNRGGSLTGPTGNLAFRHESVFSGGGAGGSTSTVTTLTTFAGALNGTVISGTLTHGEQNSGIGNTGNTINGSGSTTIPVTLTRQ